MKRKFEVAFPENEVDGYVPGDAAAHRAAAALADRLDAPTIVALSDSLTLLDRVGGQFHVVALRRSVGEEEYETIGLGFQYETRDARVQVATAPEDVLGIPIADSQAPPTEVAESPDDDSDPRDEIEAEVAALPE